MTGASIQRAGDARRRLAAPTLAMLSRIADSLSFLYLDAVRVVQDDIGVCARVGRSGGGDRVYLPTAALSCVLLGPGTSITQPALATFARHGTTVVCSGSGAVRAYAGIQPASLTTEWLERQARAWADDNERLAVATRMYERRFDTEMPPGASLAQLRGTVLPARAGVIRPQREHHCRLARAPRTRGGDPESAEIAYPLLMCTPHMRG